MQCEVTMSNCIAIIGAGSESRKSVLDIAYHLGSEIAINDYIVVCGGLAGVFEYAFKGAIDQSGIAIAVLSSAQASSRITPSVAIYSSSQINKWDTIVSTCVGGIVIGGGLGSMNLITQFLSRNKPVISIRNIEGASAEYADKFIIPPDQGFVLGADDPKEAIMKLQNEINMRAEQSFSSTTTQRLSDFEHEK